MEKSNALLDKLGIDRADHHMYGEMDLSNIDPSEVEFKKFVGEHGAGNVIRGQAKGRVGRDFSAAAHVKIRGKDYLYKIIPGEQMSERASFALDKALGLGVMPHIEVTNLGVEWMRDAGLRDGEIAEWVEMGERGGGFLQEWHVGMTSARGSGHSKNIPGLHSGFGLIAMDLILGQSDRHNGNFAIHATNGKVVAFDNGANGRFAEIEADNQRGKGLVKWELWRDHDPNPQFGPRTGNYPRLYNGLPDGMERDVFIGEFDDWFDNHIDMDTILDVAEACNMHVVGELMDGTKVTTEVIKKRLREYALSSYGLGGEPSWMNPGSGAKVKDKSPSPGRSVAADFREVTADTQVDPGAPRQARMPLTGAGMRPEGQQSSSPVMSTPSQSPAEGSSSPVLSTPAVDDSQYFSDSPLSSDYALDSDQQSFIEG